MNPENERIEVLLALAAAFGDKREARGDAHAAAGRDELLSAFDDDTRHAVRRRAEWLDRLTSEKRGEWLRHTLARARPLTKAAPALDEHLHHSHVTEALRGEPDRIRRLVVSHLPHALASACAHALGLEGDDSRGIVASASRGANHVGAATPPHVKVAADDDDSRPAPEVVAVVRRVFLSHFVTLADVERPTSIDLLSGVELVRLVRLLGVRETALACRGIAAVEAVAAFLKRFAPEDARAIAAHISTLTAPAPWRVALAGQHVHEALRVEPEPGAMLDRVGLRLLAVTLSGRSRRTSLRYAAQKLPVEAARWLRLMAVTGETPGDASATAESKDATEVRRVVAREAEEVAAGMRHRPPRSRAPREVRRADADTSGPSAQPSSNTVGTNS